MEGGRERGGGRGGDIANEHHPLNELHVYRLFNRALVSCYLFILLFLLVMPTCYRNWRLKMYYNNVL